MPETTVASVLSLLTTPVARDGQLSTTIVLPVRACVLKLRVQASDHHAELLHAHQLALLPVERVMAWQLPRAVVVVKVAGGREPPEPR